MRMFERSSAQFLLEEFKTITPTNQQFDLYIRESLQYLPCKIIVFDVDVMHSINNVMEGNIRVVFEK